MSTSTAQSLTVENFEVGADRDGQMYLQCADYGRGCWWETPIGVHTPIGDDLGSLRDAASGHLRDAHGGAG